MQYKTIALSLLEQHPTYYGQLTRQRKLLAKMEDYARQLRTSHESWMYRLSQATLGRNPMQIASEALELALRDLQESLPCEPSDMDDEAA
jgi:hypothetical protein